MNDELKNIFRVLHSEYREMVIQMCLGYTKADRYLAEDLVQEVFINVWNALPNFRRDSAPKTWIYRITVNTCLLSLRIKSSEKNIVDVEGVKEVQVFQKGDDDIDALYRAIGVLLPVERLTIMLYLENLEYEEISKIMGITEQNLRVKIHRIKKKLKTILNNIDG